MFRGRPADSYPNKGFSKLARTLRSSKLVTDLFWIRLKMMQLTSLIELNPICATYWDKKAKRGGKVGDGYGFLFDYLLRGQASDRREALRRREPMGVSKGQSPALRASGASVSGDFDRECLNSVLSALKCFILRVLSVGEN